MKVTYIVLIALLSTRLYAVEDKMIDSLQRIDSENLNKQLIPGFFIRAAEKEHYLKVAQKMTNDTYAHLNSYSGWDIVRLGKGVSQVALGSAASYAAYLYYFKKSWDISRWNVSADQRIIVGQDLTDGYQRAAVVGTLVFLAGYMFKGALDQFSAIVDKKDRLDNHRRALQNEAVIQRIPVIDQTTCEPPKKGN